MSAVPGIVEWVQANPFAVPAVAIVLLGAVLVARRPRTPNVAKRAFLTRNEMEFLVRLETALPEMRIHAQVAMGALLVPRIAEGGGRRRRATYAAVRARFDRKVVDYVLQRRDDGSVAAIVELDDRTHVPAKDRKRDAMVARAGYRTIRWQSSRKPGHALIRETVLGARNGRQR